MDMQVAWFILIGIFLVYILPKMVKDHHECKRDVAKIQAATADRQHETALLNLRTAELEAKARQKLTGQ